MLSCEGIYPYPSKWTKAIDGSPERAGSWLKVESRGASLRSRRAMEMRVVRCGCQLSPSKGRPRLPQLENEQRTSWPKGRGKSIASRVGRRRFFPGPGTSSLVVAGSGKNQRSSSLGSEPFGTKKEDRSGDRKPVGHRVLAWVLGDPTEEKVFTVRDRPATNTVILQGFEVRSLPKGWRKARELIAK